MADTPITNLSILISSNADRAVQNINRVSNSLSRLGGSSRNAAQGMGVMNDTMEHAASRTVDASSNLQSFGSRLRSALGPLRTFGTTLARGVVGGLRWATRGVGNFVSSLARIAKYRFIRSMIKDLGQSFKDLYGYSKEFGTQFAKSMDTINTSAKYFQNSIAAMVAPLIDILAPVLDSLVDKVVNLMNWVNQLFAAISGSSTYTVARKVATTWESTFDKTSNKAKKTAKEIQRTLLGFDEINRLNMPTSSSSSGGSGSSPYTPGYKTMFETKPLTGFFKDIANVTKGWPDWLKWLLGVGTVAGAAWGIKQLPKLLDKLFKGLKNLIGLNIPNWLSNLFGGKGGNGGAGGSGTYDVGVDLKKGDWTVLDDLKDEHALVNVGLAKDGWNNLAAWMGNSVVVYTSLAKDGWSNLSAWIGNSAVVYVTLAKAGWYSLTAWIGNSVVVYITLARSGWSDLSSWIGDHTTVNVALAKDGWSNLSAWMGNSAVVFIALAKLGWHSISAWIGNSTVVYVSLAKEGWRNIAAWMGNTVVVNVVLKRDGWRSLFEWSEANDGLDIATRLFKEGWDTIAKFVGTKVTVFISLAKYGWNNLTAWVGNSVVAYVYLARGNFYSLSDWIGDSVTVKVNLKMGSGGTVNVNGGSGFGGASGGGGDSVGGGVGFSRHALGGILRNGLWNNIPQYAGGTNNAGSIFLAGEAGPEIVGHVGGRTEVLNRSQLASTMYSSVVSAMSAALPAVAYAARGNSSLDSGGGGIDYNQLADTLVTAMKRAGLGAVKLDGRMLAQSINRETQRLGSPAIVF